LARDGGDGSNPPIQHGLHLLIFNLVLQICSLTIPHLKTPDEDFGGFVL
jgi:hypothetical protein